MALVVEYCQEWHASLKYPSLHGDRAITMLAQSAQCRAGGASGGTNPLTLTSTQALMSSLRSNVR